MQEAWIPVDASTPPKNELVLISCELRSGERNVKTAYWQLGQWHAKGSIGTVTAWMPLPEPYGGGR